MCTWFDETCGQLLAHLDSRNLSNNTLVIFLADNGWIQDAAADRYAPRSKQSQYDGGLRTPILVRWPGKVRAARSDAPRELDRPGPHDTGRRRCEAGSRNAGAEPPR